MRSLSLSGRLKCVPIRLGNQISTTSPELLIHGLRSWSAASVPVELCRMLRFCVSYVVGLRWITAGRGCWDDSSGTPPLADEPSGRDASNSQKLGLSPGLQEFANHLCLQGPGRNFPEAWHFHGRKSFIDCRRQGLPQPCHAEGPVGGLIPYQPAHVLNQWRWCPKVFKEWFLMVFEWPTGTEATLLVKLEFLGSVTSMGSY